jgi:hypothetical protein
MKKKYIVMLILTIMIISTLLSGLSTAKIEKLRSWNDHKKTMEGPYIIGGVFKEGEVDALQPCPYQIDEETYERIKNKVATEENGDIIGNTVFIQKQNDLCNLIEGYRTEKDLTRKNELKNWIKIAIQDMAKYLELPSELGSQIDYDYVTSQVCTRVDTLGSDPQPGGLFSNSIRCFFGLIVSGGLGVSRCYALGRPNLFQGISVLPIRTVYDWGFTGFYRPLIKFGAESGDHKIFTWGFVGIYLAFGGPAEHKYVDGISFYVGAFVYSRLSNIM